MAKKKIAFVITKSNWGGAQKYVYELATSLPVSDFECTVILGGKGELKRELEQKSVRTISLKNLERDVSLAKEWRVLKELTLIFKKEKFDVIHVNSSKIGGLGSVAGRIAKTKKIIFTAHGWAFKEERNVLSTIVIKFFSWLTILFSHKVIVLSAIEKSFVEQWPFCSNKLSIIPIGIKDISLIDRENARESLGIRSDNDTIVGNIAELHKNKGLEYAMAALSKNMKQNVVYEIIGEGEQRSNLDKLTLSLDLTKKVHLKGKILNAASLLKAFDFFLFPSIKEGLPYTVLEAGLASLPVIATNVGGIPEIITHMENGLLIPSKDPQAICDALDFYITNPDKAKEFGQKLRQNVLTKFSLENMIQKTVALYNS